MSGNLRYRLDLASLLETTVGPVLDAIAGALPGETEAAGVQMTEIEIEMPAFLEVRLERATETGTRAAPRTRFRLPSAYAPQAGQPSRIRVRLTLDEG